MPTRWRHFSTSCGIQSCHLLGHSLGCLIAARFAATRPERVLSLTLCSIAAGQANCRRRSAQKLLDQRIGDLAALGPQGMAKKRAPRLLGPAASPEALDRLKDTMGSVRPHGYGQAARMLSTGDIKADIRKLPRPAGAGDLRRCRRDHARRQRNRDVAAVWPGVAVHVIPGAGHALYLEQPETFNALLAAFLSKSGVNHEPPFAAGSAGLDALLATRAVAQAYPSKPIHIVVSVTAGGSIDTIARSYGEALSQALGQPVVIENKPGANGNIAAAAVARAAPDGYTLLATGGSTLNLNPFLYASLPFDPVKSFAPVCLTARTNFILVVHPKLGVDTVEAFIALAKAKPKTLNYGSAGSGSLIQIASELFNTTVGIETNHVPVQGAGARGERSPRRARSTSCSTSATTMSHIQAGRLKALAVIGPNRLPALPEVKTAGRVRHPGCRRGLGLARLFAPGRHAGRDRRPG